MRKCCFFVFLLSHYLSKVSSLTCYQSDSFDHKNPGEAVSECTDDKKCVRYVELKNGESQKDTIGCSQIDECIKLGEAAKSADAEIVFHCIECNEDKCIPSSPSDKGEQSSTTEYASTTPDNETASTISDNGTVATDADADDRKKAVNPEDIHSFPPPPDTTTESYSTPAVKAKKTVVKNETEMLIFFSKPILIFFIFVLIFVEW